MSYVFKRVIEDANDLMKEYICDTRADISTLPTGNKVGKNGDICAAGSECLCLADSSVNDYLTKNPIDVTETALVSEIKNYLEI